MQHVEILSVNTGTAQPIETKSGVTGIFKSPRTGPVQVARLGLDGDVICDLENHGGVDQAVYLFPKADYLWWEKELGRDLPPGTFGENLLIEGPESREVSIGDRFDFGEVTLEITSPRIPCVTFAKRMDDPGFVKRFLRANRTGYYGRVLREGTVAAGQTGQYTRFTGTPVTMFEIVAAYPLKNIPQDLARRILAAPAHHKMLEEVQNQT